MKISIFILTLLLSLQCFSQNEKSFDKYNVQTVEVLGHTFSVGDTLTLTTGSMQNGDFMSTEMTPLIYVMSGEMPPHLTAGYINHKFIIQKIRHSNDGLNTSNIIIVYINGNKRFPVWVYVDVAIAKNEIVLK